MSTILQSRKARSGEFMRVAQVSQEAIIRM